LNPQPFRRRVTLLLISKVSLQQCPNLFDLSFALTLGNPQKGREAAAPSFIKEIQEVQGGQEVSHDGDTIIPKDA
jgi:hypothetical protein